MPDSDNDGILDDADNCPDDTNSGQEDADVDLVGDVCDPFPNDSDNEQAQCEADLADCVNDPGLAQCQSALTSCQITNRQLRSRLSNCEDDEATCQTDLSECGVGLDTCSSDLGQCQDDLSQCDDCPDDGDGDEQPDGEDQCAGSPAGMATDSDGCTHEQYCAQFNVADSTGKKCQRRRKTVPPLRWEEISPAAGRTISRRTPALA